MKWRGKSTRQIAIVVAVFVAGAPTGGWLLARQPYGSNPVGTISNPVRARTAVKGAKTSGAKITKTTNPNKSAESNTIGSTGTNGTQSAASRQNLLWEEDFAAYSGSILNSSKWNVADSKTPVYNNEAQVYQPGTSTVRVADGMLTLQAQKQGNSINSGRVDTHNKLSVGVNTRLEARIRLPNGKGTWPAFWLLSQNQPHTSALRPTDAMWEQERFYMWDGEIDIMEAYGRFNSMTEATVHTFDKSIEQDSKLSDPTGWHTYWMEWRSEVLTLGVDATTLLTYKKEGKAPSSWPMTDDNTYYIILNLAMGGDGGGPIVQSAGDRWQMDVSRVAAYKL